MSRAGFLTVALLFLVAPAAQAQMLEPPFDQSYAWSSLGAPPGVPSEFGGLTLKAGTTDRLLIGGAANTSSGKLYEIGLVRDAGGHITGFSGTATEYADAAFNDGGVTYGPDGVLFLARWPANELGQIRPGDPHTYKTISLEGPPFNVESSLAALQFVPPGQPGAGSLKLSSWSGGEWYDADVAPDGNGMFDLVHVTPVPGSNLPGGPEGFVYVAPGSPHFGAPSLLVSEYSDGNVAAYEVNADGDPVVTSRRTFISGLSGAEGALLDPLTGDYLFSTFGGGNQVIVVRGFPPPVSLAVRTSVINDDGGALTPAHFSVHVLSGSADVPGSPQPGSESGTSYAVTAGDTYRVVVDSPLTYAITIGGACAADGTVTARSGVQPVCTITANDVAPPPRIVQPSQPEQELPPPVAGEKVNVVPKSGTVKVRVKGSKRFVELVAGQQIPVGSLVDTTRGRVTLIAASDKSGGTAMADFYAGLFRIGQTGGSKPITTLRLTEKLSCPKSGKANAAAKKKKRRLWGDGNGRFRTKGSYSSATVRGTKWLTEDRCSSTLTRVVKGKVSVRDFAKKKTVIVKSGKKYVAKKRR